jgi:hypothetical protein
MTTPRTLRPYVLTIRDVPHAQSEKITGDRRGQAADGFFNWFFQIISQISGVLAKKSCRYDITIS